MSETGKNKQHWDEQYWQVMNFMLANRRRPSKFRLEEHKMLNWIKYNKKMIAKGKLPEEARLRFEKLMDVAEKYRRLNRVTYADSSVKEEGVLDLFAFETF